MTCSYFLDEDPIYEYISDSDLQDRMDKLFLDQFSEW